jgi:hypothetical protein
MPTIAQDIVNPVDASLRTLTAHFGSEPTADRAYQYRIQLGVRLGNLRPQSLGWRSVGRGGPPGRQGGRLQQTVTTGAAGAVSTTAANLTGSVDPHGVATTYHFEYGTKSPSNHSPVASAGAGTATVGVSASLSKLVPGATVLDNRLDIAKRVGLAGTTATV